MGSDPKPATQASREGDSIAEDDDAPSAPVDPPTVEAIGAALQAYYRTLIEEPLPARLLVLLAELEAKEGRSG